jgi:hypothetical protein
VEFPLIVVGLTKEPEHYTAERGQGGYQAQNEIFQAGPGQTKEPQSLWQLDFGRVGSSGHLKSLMRTAYLGVKLGARFREVLSFLLLASAAATAQGNPQALVSKMVENDLESQRHPRYWMYLDLKKKPRRTELSRVIQMPECWLTWLIAIDGHPPTDEERKHAHEQLERLVNSADARKKNREEIDADGRKSAELLKLLPEAKVTLGPILFSEFRLHCPITAFVGTTGIGTKWEDAPFVESLGTTC